MSIYEKMCPVDQIVLKHVFGLKKLDNYSTCYYSNMLRSPSSVSVSSLFNDCDTN